MCRWKIILLFCFLFSCQFLFAQPGPESKSALSTYFSRQKDVLYKAARQLLIDTAENTPLVRNDEVFREYNGRIIRNIQIRTLDFGVSIKDTTKYLKNKLITISNNIHQQTRDNVIRHNLFFSEGDKLSSYLMADNEKHLRDLSFLQDAKILVEPVDGSSEFVDVILLTKDMLSLGGSVNIHSNESAGLTVKEDNLFGWGDHIQMQTFYDLKRDQKMGYGFAYTKRNIAGSFIDASAGHMNFVKAFTSDEKEEQVTYLKLEKPLVNRFMQWKYGLEASVHSTQNLYNIDSIYHNNFVYRYHIFDAYAAWNMDADKTFGNKSADRFRRLLGFRFFEQNFSDRPLRYANNYLSRYADITAVLGDISLFKQNFYKTHHVYGFGRNEDVPEGGGGSFTTGYTKINNRERLYLGFNLQRYYFTPTEHYFNYTLRAGTYLYKEKMEDVNMLLSLDYFSRLHHLYRDWKNRNFFNISLARQIRSVFNDPLVVESVYGLQDFKNNNLGATSRITLKGESVFFSPWSLMFFKFAPFVFANASVLNIKMIQNDDRKLYSAVGGGFRIRNESLVFKTIELKGMYFPRKNYYNESWRFEIGTNIRFRYNHEFIRRPDFVSVN